MTAVSTVIALALALAGGAPTAALQGAHGGAAVPQEQGSTRVGVLPLVIASDAAPEVGDARERLSAQVHETLSATTYESVLLHAEQAGDAASPYCADAVCWQQLSSQYDVTHFLVVVVHFSDPDYRINARLVDGRSGLDVGAQQTTCDLCGVAELEERVRDVAATMRRDVEATLVLPPVLYVTSTPTGATVSVDGERVGVTTLEMTAVAGRHRVEIAAPGHVTEALDVELVGGVRRELAVPLRPEPPEPVAMSSAHNDRGMPGKLLGLGIGSIVAGAGAVAGGAVLVVLDDQPIDRDCDGSNVDALGRCRYLHDTIGGGIGLVVGGGALLVAGVVVTALVAKSRRRVTLGPAPGLRGIALSGRF